MKTTKILGLIGLTITVSGAAQAVTYTPINLGSWGGNPAATINSVDVTNDASSITFRFNLGGDPTVSGQNWAKYCVIGRDASNASVDTTATGNNPWGRTVVLTGGANMFIGGWADQATSNNLEYSYSAGSWTNNTGGTSVITTSSYAYTVSLASLGLAAGDTVVFDAFATGSNADPAISSLTGDIPTSWSYTSVLKGDSYTVTGAVPEPMSMGVLALGAAALLRRRKK